MAHVRELICSANDELVINRSKSPWFVTLETPLLQLLDQFRRNNQSIAVILETSGKACGILTLDQILDTLFGRQGFLPKTSQTTAPVLDRTLDANMTIEEFNREFEAELPGKSSMQIGDLMSAELGHAPVRGESVRIDIYEFTLVELTPRQLKKIAVRTIAD